MICRYLTIQIYLKYVGTNQACKFNPSTVGARVLGYVDVNPTESALQNAVATIGPISVAITVINSFYSYSSGVYYDSTCNNYGLNHGGKIHLSIHASVSC